jgi:hypothetical protein
MRHLNALGMMMKTNKNSDHHLWNNNGTWFVHYTRYPTRSTKERVRLSLKTKCLAEARRRRDEILRREAAVVANEMNPEPVVLTA